MRHKVILIFLVMLGATFSPLIAQSGDDNACNPGGAMDGQCGNDPYLWQVGWYKAALNAGRISPTDLPLQFQFLAPDGTVFGNLPPADESNPTCGYPQAWLRDEGQAGLFFCIKETADSPPFCFLRP